MFSRLAIFCAVAAGITQGVVAGPVSSVFTDVPVATPTTIVFSSVEGTATAVAFSSIEGTATTVAFSSVATAGGEVTSVFTSVDSIPSASAVPTTIVFSSVEGTATCECVPTTVIFSGVASASPVTVTNVASSSEEVTSVFTTVGSVPTKVSFSSVGSGGDACPSIGSTVTVTATATAVPVASSFTTVVGGTASASSSPVVTLTATV
ncbi:hypothetical protein BDY19DRAFT_991825 [Irpex rosettiformis]|uniref:Uncharacterized protein n=1 Tax=Irpex rosettiformis TaxID=378272 RepID=A0ACB8UAQ8_9APHY|nr:hypothetical protein BDY19DRAFT_991825 [Irpex rosettiformis]